MLSESGTCSAKILNLSNLSEDAWSISCGIFVLSISSMKNKVVNIKMSSVDKYLDGLFVNFFKLQLIPDKNHSVFILTVLVNRYRSMSNRLFD